MPAPTPDRRTEKQKTPQAIGITGFLLEFWRKGWDSFPASPNPIPNNRLALWAKYQCTNSCVPVKFATRCKVICSRSRRVDHPRRREHQL